MARLNRETFGRRGPTNIIAFPLEDVAKVEEPHAVNERAGTTVPPGTGRHGPAPILGEVVISVETTVRQARETGWPWQELLDFYLIHGILHLLGYDHEDPDDEKRMDAKTWDLMGLLHPKIVK
jgi:probable rRNA maturation factor